MLAIKAMDYNYFNSFEIERHPFGTFIPPTREHSSLGLFEPIKAIDSLNGIIVVRVTDFGR